MLSTLNEASFFLSYHLLPLSLAVSRSACHYLSFFHFRYFFLSFFPTVSFFIADRH